MSTPHATEADLTTYLAGETVPGVARLLERASELVDYWVRTPYQVDAQGVAVDADTAEALRKATCAQIEQWIEVGEANDIDGLARTQHSTAGYSGLRPPPLAPRAHRILANAGLFNLSTVHLPKDLTQ